MPPAAVAAAGRLAAYVLATSVDVPQVRLPRRSGRAPRFGSAAYGVPPARLDLATASFLRCALVAVVLAGCGGPSLVVDGLALAPDREERIQGGPLSPATQ